MTRKKPGPSFKAGIKVEDNEEAQAVAAIQYLCDWGEEALATAPLIADLDRAHIQLCMAQLKSSFCNLARIIEPLGKANPPLYKAAFQQISKLTLSAHGIGIAVSSSGPGRHHARSLHTYKMRKTLEAKQVDSPEEKVIQEEMTKATKDWNGKRPSFYRLAANICDSIQERGVTIGTDAMHDRLKRKYSQEPFKGADTSAQ